MKPERKTEIGRTRRHQPFFIAATLGVGVCVVSLITAPSVAVETAAVAFFLTYLVLVARRLPRLTASHLKAHADRDDLPAVAIIAITLMTVVVAVASLFLALNHKGETALSLSLAFASVVLGWLTIHVMAAVHYAHLFWRPGQGARPAPKGGLSFPETEAPGIYEFLYFAVVIGMTAQTSDVSITTTSMRKATLVHSIVSFFFNTVLVAAAVNAAVSLAG